MLVQNNGHTLFHRGKQKKKLCIHLKMSYDKQEHFTFYENQESHWRRCQLDQLRYNQTSVSKPAQTVLGILLNIYLTGENTSLRPQTPPSEQGHEAWCVCGFCSGKELVHAKVQKVWMLNVKIQSFFKTFRNKACSKTKLFNIQQYTLY